MSFGSWCRDLLRTLGEQKVRAASTLLGVTWGTLSIVLLLAFGTGIEANMKKEAAGFGKSIGIVSPSRTTIPFEGLGEGRWIPLIEDEVRRLPQQIPELVAVGTEYSDWENLQVGARVIRVQLSGVNPDFGRLRNIIPQPGGRFIDALDLTERRRVAFVGNRTKDVLFGAAPAIGKTLVLRGIPFTVVGELKPREQSSNYGSLDKDRVFIPATTHAHLFGRRHLSNFIYRSKSPDVHAHATRMIYEKLGRSRRFDPSDTKALHLWDTTELERMLDAIFLAFNLLLAGSGALTLLVGGVGIANLMHIMVRQRTHEIGIQLAIGARPRRILHDVMAQAFALVTAGGAIGFLVAWVVARVVAGTSLTQEIGIPEISFPVAVPAVTLLLVTGLLAGWFPARRAAQLDPIAALQE